MQGCRHFLKINLKLFVSVGFQRLQNKGAGSTRLRRAWNRSPPTPKSHLFPLPKFSHFFEFLMALRNTGHKFYFYRIVSSGEEKEQGKEKYVAGSHITAAGWVKDVRSSKTLPQGKQYKLSFFFTSFTISASSVFIEPISRDRARILIPNSHNIFWDREFSSMSAWKYNFLSLFFVIFRPF